MLKQVAELVYFVKHRSAEQVAVVIPIYKQNPNPSEAKSLAQGLKVFSSYPIVFIAPDNLDTTYYEECSKEHTNIYFQRFHDSYFKSIGNYNALMTAKFFYKTFLKYQFILIYQLDAFVFRDELEYWCSLNYDYIGAPWLDGWMKPYLGKMNWYRNLKWKIQNREGLVGNGGYSLRKTKSLLLALILFGKNDSEVDLSAEHEDVFFSRTVPRKIPFFSIPSIQVAVKFAFETNPALCFRLNNCELPFGCHGWEKNDPDFYKEHIPPGSHP